MGLTAHMICDGGWISVRHTHFTGWPLPAPPTTAPDVCYLLYRMTTASPSHHRSRHVLSPVQYGHCPPSPPPRRVLSPVQDSHCPPPPRRVLSPVITAHQDNMIHHTHKVCYITTQRSFPSKEFVFHGIHIVIVINISIIWNNDNNDDIYIEVVHAAMVQRSDF